MYLNFFNLKKEPFQITPDPSFLYLSPGHKEALASIIYGVEKKKGFVLIVGAVGVGKTTILRAYLEKAEKTRLKIIYLFNSNISYHNLLRFIFRELGRKPESDEVCEMVNELHQALINEYQEGRNVLLLIDEAQNMPADTLENLRMLSNLETATEKLIQIVFSAQPEFEKTLALEELKQLKQRIAVKAVIAPLNRDEGLAYIHHRLKKASDRESIIFSPRALKEIVRTSEGIPRVINVLCDNCLISAFGYGKKKVSLGVVREIIRDFGMRKPFYVRWRWSLAAALLLVVVALAGGGLYQRAALTERNPDLALRPVKSEAGRAEAAPVAEKEAVAAPAAAPAPAPVGEDTIASRVIARGDTLARLIKDVYGQVDSRLIRMVKKANPAINDENLIVEGGRIVFPARKKP
jgi:general secretion pathway protein A